MYENYGVKNYMKEDHRSYRRNFCSFEKKAWKKSPYLYNCIVRTASQTKENFIINNDYAEPIKPGQSIFRHGMFGTCGFWGKFCQKAIVTFYFQNDVRLASSDFW